MSHNQENEQEQQNHPHTVAPDIEKPDDIILAVRDMRLRILNKQISSGVPTDGDVFETVHKNLQELEKSAVTEKKQISEERKNEDDGVLARAIANEIMRKSGNQVFGVGEGSIPDPSAEIAGAHTEVPGETSVGDDSRKFEDFMKEAGEDIDARVRSGELILSEVQR